MLPTFLLFAVLAPLLAVAQDDGGISGAQTSAEAAGYSCDSSSVNCQIVIVRV